MRLYNKGDRTIQYQEMNLQPGKLADFSEADRKHAEYLLKCFPDELEDADKSAEKFNEKGPMSADKFTKAAKAGEVDDTAHPLLQEETEAAGGKVTKGKAEADAENDGDVDSVFANKKAEAYANEQGIDLTSVTPSGRDGKITMADLKAAQG